MNLFGITIGVNLMLFLFIYIWEINELATLHFFTLQNEEYED